MAHPRPLPATCTNGELAVLLIHRSVTRVVELHGPVLADEDPEPLHQMRVAMRRLRTTLSQFAPALLLPPGLSDQRIAKSVRRLGLARDLDVLRERLDNELIPVLPREEKAALKPVFRQLRRERRIAYEHLEAVLRGSSHLQGLACLQAWLREPQFTPLGQEPLHRWVEIWQLPLLERLFLHGGWWAENFRGQAHLVHDLRKEIKGARYRLENLRGTGGRHQSLAIACLRSMQDLLGELNDLEVLAKAIDNQMPCGIGTDLPVLADRLERRRGECWGRWRAEARPLRRARGRRRLMAGLRREAAHHHRAAMCSAIPRSVAIRVALLLKPQ